MARCLIGFGANLGDGPATFQQALTLLESGDLEIRQHSQLLRTRAVGGESAQPDYFNGAFVGETTLAPEALLDRLQQVEHQLGRQRTERWGSRTIDLDLLLYGEQIFSSPRLILPHPRFAVRWFAIAPAAEIAPDWVHPQLGWTIERLRQHVAEAANYVAICGVPQAEVTQLAHDVAREIPSVLVTQDGLGDRPAQGMASWNPADFPAAGERWLISDFLNVPSAESPAGSSIVPKLIVLLEGAERIAQVSVPVLRCPGDDPAWARRELLAALHGMRPVNG